MAVTEPIRLITGWEPEVPVGDTVLRRLVHAWAESLAGPVAAVGGRIERRAGLVAGDLGRPVGAAASYVAHGLHVLALGVVVAEARRRGYWQALLHARLVDLAGLRSAGLFGDMSRPGAERNGFLPVARFTLWRRGRP